MQSSPGAMVAEPMMPCGPEAEGSGEQLEQMPVEESPGSQLFELEIEALPLESTSSPEERDISSSRKQPEEPVTTVLENGAAMVTSTSFNGGVSPQAWGNSPPPCKRSRKENKQTASGPLGARYPSWSGSWGPGGAPPSASSLCSDFNLSPTPATWTGKKARGMRTAGRCKPCPAPRPP